MLAAVRTRPAAGFVAAAPTVMVTPQIINSVSGQLASGTALTITLPTREAGDYLTLILSTNQAPTYTFGSGVASSTSLASAGSRLQVFTLTTTAGATTVAATASVNAVHTWWIASWRNVNAAATPPATTNVLGTNATSTVEILAVPLGYTSTGHEVCIYAAGTNSTATWTTGSGSFTYATTSGNAALAVQAVTLAGGLTSAPATTFDRGLSGTSRNESSLAFVLPPATTTASGYGLSPYGTSGYGS